jgi:hypothetical protein
VALGWTVGMVAFVLTTWLSSDEVFRRVELGLCGLGVALIVFALALRSRLGNGACPFTAPHGALTEHAASTPDGPATRQRAMPASLAASIARSFDHHRPASPKATSAPSPASPGLGRIADEQVDLGRTEELRVLADVALASRRCRPRRTRARTSSSTCASRRSR